MAEEPGKKPPKIALAKPLPFTDPKSSTKEASARWRKNRKDKLASLEETYNSLKPPDLPSETLCVRKKRCKFKGQPRPSYKPTREEREKMSMEDLSKWRAEQKRKRKADAQRQYRQQLRQKELMMMKKVNELKGGEVYTIRPDDEASKHHLMYLPPPEELSTMSKTDLSEWRATERKKRKLEQQRIRRDNLKEERKKAKAANEDESKILSKKIIAQNTAKWRKNRMERLTLLTTTYNNYQISRGLPTMSLDPMCNSGSKSNKRPSYEPPPEELKEMTQQELSAWRAEQKRLRKAEAQREYRNSVKEKEEVMKLVVDGLSPEERSKFAGQAGGGDPASARDGLPKVDEEYYNVQHDESKKGEASRKKNFPQGRDQEIMKEAVHGLSPEERLKFAAQAGQGDCKSGGGLPKVDEKHYKVMGEARKRKILHWGDAQNLHGGGRQVYYQIVATTSETVSDKLMSMKYELARRREEMMMTLPVPTEQFSTLPCASKNAQICYQKAKNNAFFVELYTSKCLLDAVTKSTLPLTREQAYGLSLSQRYSSRTTEGGAAMHREVASEKATTNKTLCRSVRAQSNTIEEQLVLENPNAGKSEEEQLKLLAHANKERKLRKGCLVPVKVFEKEL